MYYCEQYKDPFRVILYPPCIVVVVEWGSKETEVDKGFRQVQEKVRFLRSS